jgi:membrane protein implicated in regulation of membrane protease activity
MPRALNVALAWIATIAGMAEILFYVPRSWLIALSVIVSAILTWLLLHRFGVSRKAIARSADQRRRQLGY